MGSKIIIGLVGVKQSGKSTSGEIIRKYLPFAKEAALADKLKNVCASVFGLERKQFDLQELKEVPLNTPKILTKESIKEILDSFKIDLGGRFNKVYNEIIGMELNTPRHIAQIVGTEVLRSAGDPDVHCKNIDLSESNTIIVTDVRFNNEFNFFNNNEKVKFIPIYIHRKEAEKHVTELSHQSEKEVLEFCGKCIMIDNNKTLEELDAQLKCVLSLCHSSLS